MMTGIQGGVDRALLQAYQNTQKSMSQSLTNIVQQGLSGESSAVGVLEAGASNASFQSGRLAASDSRLEQAGGILNRLGELSIQASDPTLQSSDRSALNLEATQLQSELGNIVGNATYNAQGVLNGGSVSVQVNGPTQYQDGDGASVLSALGTLDLSTAAGANAAMNQIVDAQSTLSQERTQVGVSAAQMERAGISAQNQAAALASSSSFGPDLAKEVANIISAKVQGQAALFALKTQQSNANNVLGLVS